MSRTIIATIATFFAAVTATAQYTYMRVNSENGITSGGTYIIVEETHSVAFGAYGTNSNKAASVKLANGSALLTQ